MKTLYLMALAGMVTLQIALVNLARADWAACMEIETPGRSSGILIAHDWMTLLAFALPALPFVALAFGTERPDRFAWIAVVIQLGASLYLMLPYSAMHDCDRKGSNAEFVVIFLFPLSLMLVSLVLLGRKTSQRHE